MYPNTTELQVKALELITEFYIAKENACNETDANVCEHCINTITSVMKSELTNHEIESFLESVTNTLKFFA